MDLPIELEELLRREDASVEWKKGVADAEDVVRKLTAFANKSGGLGDGGWVVCGVEEEKDEHGFARARLVGLPASRFKEIRGKVLSLCRERVSPPLVPSVYERPIAEDASRRILVFAVAVSPHAHAFHTREGGDKYWILSGSNTVEAKGHLLRVLLRRKEELPPFLEQPCRDATIDDVNQFAAEEFFKAARLPLPVSNYLEPDVPINAISRPLVVSEITAPGVTTAVPTNLAVLLFGREPARFIPGAYVVFSVYEGTTRAERHSQRFETTRPIPQLISDMLGRLQLYTGVAIDKSQDLLTGQQNKWRYSEEALQEAVVNAFAHRDYEDGEPTRITVFADRIEIANPGGIEEDVDPQRFVAGQEPPRWRNKALASFLLRMGLAQSQGKGIPAIVKNTLELAGREPEILPTGSWFQVVLPAYQPADRSVSKTQVSISHLPVTANGFAGRDAELRRLDAAWDDPNIHVLSLVAWGGVGKTALVNRWLITLAAASYRGADRVLGWSFYSQGTGDRTASADPFIDFALRYLDDPDPSAGSASDRGFRLAGRVRRQRTLLVLDGIEPLQHPPGSTLAGRLKDPALATLIRELASENPGLCVITTRVAVADLAQFAATTAPQIDLEQLPPEAGAELLRQLGVNGSERELRAAAAEVGGHALTLTLVGNYLRKVHAGDVGCRVDVELGRADARQGGHGYRVIAAYERALGSGPELAILRLLGLFDRPAAGTEIAALRAAPAIPDLTESLVGIAEDDWRWALSNLRENGLLAPVDPHDPASLDSHPLVRAYFGDQLRQRHPEAWSAGNLRLREHQRISARGLPGGRC